jgi:DNA-binding NarL/FixJ family response regulator
MSAAEQLHQSWSRADIERLMTVNVALSDLTHSTDLCVKAPAYLSRALELEPITLAIIAQENREAPPRLVCLGASGAFASGQADAAFREHILGILRQVPPATRDSQNFRSTPDAARGFAQTAVSDHLPYPRQLVLLRVLSETHRLMLVVHLTADQRLPSGALAETLVLAADQLGRQLRTTFAWQDSPAVLGSPFERLTDREWAVLRGLNSEDGEKQLAERLDLSPHTLHSHIKSIYRKVGVQGRLPLLLRLNAAVRELRLSHLPMSRPTQELRERAVGA